MTALELLQSLNLLDETERIEAKRASESGKSLLETVCAFANEPGLGGGWLVLGVVREEQALFPNYQVEGVPHPDKLCADLATQCRETFNAPVRIELSTEQVNGMAVVVAFVPEAQAQDAAFMAAKITTARFYGDHILSKVPGMRDSIVEGADSVTALPLDAF